MALAAGQLGGTGVREPFQPEALEQLGQAGAAAVRDVLADRHVREEGVFLEDESDGAPLRLERGAAVRVEPGLVVERDRAPLGSQETGDGSQERALAGAGGADEGHRLRADLEVYLEAEGAKGGKDGC